MDEHDALERRKRAAFRRLGTDDPRCVTCGEAYWGCLELHHVAGQAYDSTTVVILCRNCHRKLSDPSANSSVPPAPSRLEQIGHLLLGLAALFVMLAEQLKKLGRELLDAARDCPPPNGRAVPALLGG